MNSIEIPESPTILQTLGKIRSREVKVVDLVKEHLQKAHQINPEINAFITILDDAIEKAKEIDKKLDAGEEVGKLAGIPFTVKDLYLVEGTKTTFSSKLMEDFIAPYTSTIVQKCLDEGAILIGKTNSDPWGFGGSGENSGFGPVKHPLDFSKTPGGSSSGSAASILAGVGFFSLATDTGGSVRLPASFCGIYGLKPTYGRNSRYGIGSMGSSFDTPGFFANHLEDIAYVEEIIAGKDINDATSSETPVNNYLNDIQQNPKLRIGIPKEYFGEGLNSEVQESIQKKIVELQELGHEIKEVSIPSTEYALSVYYILVPSEISSNRAKYDGVRFGKKVSDEYEDNMIGSRSRFLENEVKRRIMIGTYALSAGYGDQFYKNASKVRTKLKLEFEKVFEDVDVLIAPVSPSTAFKLGERSSDPVAMYLGDIYTVTANIVGIPSLAVPISKDKCGMPIGLQIMGRNFEESVIFQLANQLSH
jgi:aspartyl-tRNA(Asn)/glutamyl-tRNA(Gln) amidotransferase subunit A